MYTNMNYTLHPYPLHIVWLTSTLWLTVINLASYLRRHETQVNNNQFFFFPLSMLDRVSNFLIVDNLTWSKTIVFPNLFLRRKRSEKYFIQFICERLFNCFIFQQLHADGYHTSPTHLRTPLVPRDLGEDFNLDYDEESSRPLDPKKPKNAKWVNIDVFYCANNNKSQNHSLTLIYTRTPCTNVTRKNFIINHFVGCIMDVDLQAFPLVFNELHVPWGTFFYH